MLSLRRVFALWWPLATSSLLMSAEMPIINSGIARLPNPEVALAGFALAATLANLIEAPILMMIGAAAALATDRAMIRLLQRFTVFVACLMTACYFLISFTPVADLILRQWLRVPPEVADACLPAFRILICWPIPTGWRRLHQGILIRLRRTRVIGAGTIVRLGFVALFTVLVVTTLQWPGASSGAAISATVIILEAILVSYWARRLFTEIADAPAPRINYWQLLTFYLPLVMVSMMNIIAQPLIATSLARAPFPTESLAAWPIVWGLTGLIGSICAPLQETTIAFADRHDALRSIRRIGLMLGASASIGLALLALTPLADFYFGQLIGLSTTLRAFTNSTLVLLIPYPFLLACEMMLRGFLIRQQRTAATRLAMGCYLLILGASLVAGSMLRWGNGTQTAAIAVLLAISSEVLLLTWQAVPVLRTMRHSPTLA
jgi:hypothetical protein